MIRLLPPIPEPVVTFAVNPEASGDAAGIVAALAAAILSAVERRRERAAQTDGGGEDASK